MRPAITAVTPDDVRKIAGPRPSSPAWPVTSTKVSVDTAAASCSTTELTALVVDSSSVFRRITGARSAVICTNPRTGRRIIASEGMPDKASAEIAAAGRTLVLSNPAKTFFPERGETKLDLANYYLAIEQPLMRALGGRPVLMERYPDGAGGSSFFQKRVPKNAPDWLQTTTVQTPNGTPSQALVAADVAHIVWAVNLGCIGLHVWPYLAADPDHTDELRIDLDPSPGVDLAMVKEAATETRALLDELGIEGHPKTTGRNGIHVYVRLRPRAGLVRGARGGGGPGPRAGAPPSRPDHRRLVEGGAGRARVRRLQPERAAQDRDRRLDGAAAARRARSRCRSHGTSSTTSIPEALTLATVPDARCRTGRRLGVDAGAARSRWSR